MNVERACQTCGKVFFVVPSRIKAGHGIYCSKSCTGKANGRARQGVTNPEIIALGYVWEYVSIYVKGNICMYLRAEHSCDRCGKVHYITTSQAKKQTVDKNKKFYCSHVCADISNRSPKSPVGLEGVERKKFVKKLYYERNKEIILTKQKNIKRVAKICRSCNCQFRITKSDDNRGRGLFCSVKCRATYYRKYSSTAEQREHARFKQKRNVEMVTSSYVRGLLGLVKQDAPQELIELKRAHLILKREIRNAKNYR